jgi:putative tryptophan/tyrosine transport system substrate-binding protein
MRRRDFIKGLFWSAAIWPLAAAAQQSAKVPRIGFLCFGSAAVFASRVDALRAGLRDLGYVEGQNILIEYRWWERADQLPELAADLVRMKVDVIFAVTSTEVEAARQLAKTIPIVFAFHADPVGVGHVVSLARPGGNITGLSMVLTELSAKDLEILKEVAPQATRIGILWNPTTPSHTPALKAIQAGGEKLGLQLLMVSARTAGDLTEGFSMMTRQRVEAFLALGSPLIAFEHLLLAELELKHRLPGVFSNRGNVEAGGLISYGPDINDLIRRAVVYIDKILKGTKPADLPVEQASKYELVINLKTARALGLSISPSLLARAEEVIE